MCPNIWNAHRIQSEVLECISIVKECTANFHSDGIPAHSGTRVTAPLLVISLPRVIFKIYDLEVRANAGITVAGCPVYSAGLSGHDRP